MPPEIYDKEGNRQDMDWLHTKYGNVQFLDAGEGSKFRLARVDETEGPATLKVRVIDEQGAAKSGQPVANSWPDPSLPDLRNQGLQTLWQDRAINQPVDSAGFTGFGLGTGSYIRDLARGGPHSVWVLSPSLPSDGMSGLGMLGGTNHMGPLFLTFQIGAEGGGDPGGGGDPDPTYEALMEKLEAIHADLRLLMEHLGATEG